jgi:hypothetical protein
MTRRPSVDPSASIICTELVPPPIRTRHIRTPMRDFGWYAFRDGDDSPINWGYGASQESAVLDLLSKERTE